MPQQISVTGNCTSLMGKPRRFSIRENGFSLIELMIVVLIIGISTSMAVIYIDTSDDRLKSEAKRLFAMVQLARDDAIFKGESLGLVIKPDEYSFSRLEDGKWIQIIEKPYRVFELSSDLKLRSLSKNNQADLIYFLPTGESSEFQVWISNNNDSEYVLNGNILGELSLKPQF